MTYGQNLNPSQAAIQNKVLTNVVQGYRNDQLHWDFFFPQVSIQSLTAHVIKFGKEAFRLINTKRAPGGTVKRVGMGYEGEPVALQGHSLAAETPLEYVIQASAQGIPLRKASAKTVMLNMMRYHEYECSTLARDTDSYAASNKVTLAGGTRWTQSGSDVLGQIQTGKDAIRSDIGMYPTHLGLSVSSFNALRRHADILALFGSNERKVITAEMIANVLEIKKIRILTSVSTPSADASSTFTDMWGNDAIMAYVPEGNKGTFEQGEPSFGYTYRLAGYPYAKKGRDDPDREVYVDPVHDYRKAYVTSMGAGYLLKDAGDNS